MSEKQSFREVDSQLAGLLGQGQGCNREAAGLDEVFAVDVVENFELPASPKPAGPTEGSRPP